MKCETENKLQKISFTVGEIRDLSTGALQKAHGLAHKTQIYCNELIQLSLSMHQLSTYSYEKLLAKYMQTINQNETAHYPIVYDLYVGDRTFGCLRQTYRKYDILKYNMNRIQLLFVSLDSFNGNNFEYSGKQYTFCDLKYDEGIHRVSRDLRHRYFHLLPLPFINCNNNNKPNSNKVVTTHLNSYVCFGYPQHMTPNDADKNHTELLLDSMIDSLVMSVNKLDLYESSISTGNLSSIDVLTI